MKQEQTTPTKRPGQKLKAAKKGSMLCLLGFLPGRQVVLSRNILKNGHCDFTPKYAAKLCSVARNKDIFFKDI